MKLMWKFNLALAAVFAFGLLVTGVVSYGVLQANAKEEILDNARVMMESALSSRSYTNTQIKPLLETQLRYSFLPQSVPAYAATEQFNLAVGQYNDAIAQFPAAILAWLFGFQPGRGLRVRP